MKVRRAKTTPRKLPKQERAAATVDAILQASAYILDREGWAGLTTNRVATRAGVNIASLYQYFPNKEAIVVELQRRHICKIRGGFPRAAQQLRSQASLRSALRVIVQAGIDEHREQPELHRVFSDELPRSATIQTSAHDIEQAFREYIEPFARNVPDLDVACFIVKAAFQAIVHATAIERPAWINTAEFADEVILLFERYLRRSTKRRKRAKLPATPT